MLVDIVYFCYCHGICTLGTKECEEQKDIGFVEKSRPRRYVIQYKHGQTM